MVLAHWNGMNAYRSDWKMEYSILVFSLPHFLMQVKPGSTAPCYNNNYDDDSDGDDNNTAECRSCTNNSSSIAAFRRKCAFRRRCSAFRSRKYYGEIEFTFNYIRCKHMSKTYTSVQAFDSGCLVV